MTNTALSLLGLVLSALGGLGLGSSPQIKLLFSDPETEVDRQYRTWYHGPMGDSARDWRTSLLADVRLGRRTTALWLAIFAAGVSLSAIGLI